MERKMNKPLYKRELSHSYLVMENVPEELSGHYQYRMILRNRIPGLLSSSERYLEGRICLYYDISSRQSLEQLYLSARIGMKEIRGIIDNLAQVLDSMSEYLLEERFLILKPEYIFMDLETEQLFFLYYPFSEEKAKMILQEKSVSVLVVLHDGEERATAWGCDLTYDYVRINGDYRS